MSINLEIVKNKAGNQRNSSIELLRIISMIMIVACHFATHGCFSFNTQFLSAPRLWWNFIEMGGNLGVDVFVLISGYFLVVSKSGWLNLRKILKFWGQVFIYSVAIYIVFCIVGKTDFEFISCVKAIFPITFGSWWFASTYFVLYLMHPFINKLLQKLDKKTYKALVVMLLITWCVIPTFTTSDFQSNNLLWFITLYCVAGYVKLFGLNPQYKKRHYVLFAVLFSALRYLSCVILMAIGTKIPVAATYSLYFYGQKSVLTFLSALSLFMAFEKCNIGYNKWINIAASASFGVYLIHDSNLIRPLLWHEVFKNAQFQDTLVLIPYSIIVVALVYIVCTLIDLIRQHIIEKPFICFVNRYSEKIIKPFKRIIDLMKCCFFGKEA